MHSLCVVVAFCLTLLFLEPQKTRRFSDDRLTVDVPRGWSGRPVYVNVTGDQEYQKQVGFVLIDGRFQLYLLSHYGQASGIAGGRFGEIATYVAPWMALPDPWACFGSFETRLSRVTAEMSRVDLLIAPGSHPASQDPECNQVRNSSKDSVWSGAYFGITSEAKPIPGFFLTYPMGSKMVLAGEQMVFAATAIANDPSSLPHSTDPMLISFLANADKVIERIREQRR